MHKLLFVNISRYFDLGFRLFKPFIPEATRDKIVMIVKLEDLFEYISQDELPVVYGGTRGFRYSLSQCFQ